MPPIDCVWTGEVSVIVQMPARYIIITIAIIIKSKKYSMKRVRLKKKLCFDTMTADWWIYTIKGYA